MSILRSYFFLLGLIFVPGALVGALVASTIQGVVSRYMSSIVRRLGLAAATLPLWAFVTSWVGSSLLGEQSGVVPRLIGSPFALASSAILPFCIVLPWTAVTAYTVRTEEPVWWKAGLLGAGAVIVGAALWLVLGMALGAQTN